MAVGAAIRIGIRDVFDSAEQRAESFALRRFRCGERKSAHGAAVEASVKRNELVTLGGISRQFDGAFDCLGARIGEKDLLAFQARHGLAQPLRQLRHALVIKIRAGHVNQLGGLLLDRSDDFRVAVSCGAHGDAGSEIEEGVAVHVFDDGAVPALGHQRIVARIRRRHEFCVLLQDALGVRPG